MKKLKWETLFEEKTVGELDEKESALMQAAIEAARRAYAVYSHFHVGAAVRLSDGEVVIGSNQENAAYPSGLCAERTALFYAGAKYPDVSVEALAIVALSDGEVRPSISPCGACRQVLLETEQRGGTPIRIMLCGKERVIIIPSAKDLLPFSFRLEGDSE